MVVLPQEDFYLRCDSTPLSISAIVDLPDSVINHYWFINNLETSYSTEAELNPEEAGDYFYYAVLSDLPNCRSEIFPIEVLPQDTPRITMLNFPDTICAGVKLPYAQVYFDRLYKTSSSKNALKQSQNQSKLQEEWDVSKQV